MKQWLETIFAIVVAGFIGFYFFSPTIQYSKVSYEQQPGQHLVYDDAKVMSYSTNEIQTILKSDQRLTAVQLDKLYGRIKSSTKETNKKIDETKKACLEVKTLADELKNTINGLRADLKTVSDELNSEKKKQTARSSAIFYVTVFGGLMLAFFRFKKALNEKGKKRFIEFGLLIAEGLLGCAILYINTFI